MKNLTVALGRNKFDWSTLCAGSITGDRLEALKADLPWPIPGSCTEIRAVPREDGGLDFYAHGPDGELIKQPTV